MEATQGDPGAAAATTDAALGAEAIDAGAVESTGAHLDVADTGAEASDGDTAISEADAADAADLEQYPEEVRDRFRALSSEQRKEQYEFYEYAGKNVEARIKANKERTDRLEAEQKAQEERRKEIRSKTGKHVGAEAQTLELPDGSTIDLPSYDDLETLSKTQRGRDQLVETYGLSNASAEFWRFVFDRNREMLDASADMLDDAAWGKLNKSMVDGIRDEMGIDPARIIEGAQNPHDVIRGIKNHFQGQIAQLKKEHEARSLALNASVEGMRGVALAGSARALATGGRSSGGGDGELTLARYNAMSSEERRGLTPSQRDEMMQRHQAARRQAGAR